MIDAHLHLWDPAKLSYPWLEGAPSLNRPFLLEDYRAASRANAVEAMVFVQCEAAPADAFAEAQWIASLVAEEPRIAGIVAWAPLEKGEAAEPDLARLAKLDRLCGVRRIIQYEPDPEFCLQPGFIAGVRMLRRFDLTFDICIDWLKLPQATKLAAQAPEVRMVLNHLGKPAVKSGETEPWASQLRQMARLDHVWCKISGVATEADHSAWSDDQLRRYIDIAVDAFGFDRVFFGGDWPVATQAITFARWVEVVESALAGSSAAERAKLWRDNAIRFYSLNVGAAIETRGKR